MIIPVKPSPQVAAFTLVELLVSVAISSVVMGIVLYAFIFSTRSFVAMGNYVDLNKASLFALDRLSRDIREASSMQTFATNRLVLLDANTNQLTIAWDPNSGLLTRTLGASTTTLLKNCDYLLFDIFQRNPTDTGAMGFYSASNNPAICKLVSVSWRCSRTILGQKINTESVQTAKIVIRN